jgi:uncharacterized membrane protein YkoI
MFRNKFAPYALATALLLGAAGAGTVALASERERDRDTTAEMQAVAAMRTTLPQAIAAAEQATGGRAIEAGVDHEGGRLTLKVETLKGTERQEVTINPDTGAVLHVAAADED